MENNGGKVEVIDMAIRNEDEAHQYKHALSQELELLKKRDELELNKQSKASSSEIDEIMKEVKKIKRQNFVTHCLLSVMIVITIGWQLSEATLLLKVKDGMNHPFRSFKTMLKGMIKVPEINDHKNKEQQSESPPLIPNVPQLDVANLTSHNGEH